MIVRYLGHTSRMHLLCLTGLQSTKCFVWFTLYVRCSTVCLYFSHSLYYNNLLHAFFSALIWTLSCWYHCLYVPYLFTALNVFAYWGKKVGNFITKWFSYWMKLLLKLQELSGSPLKIAFIVIGHLLMTNGENELILWNKNVMLLECPF